MSLLASPEWEKHFFKTAAGQHYRLRSLCSSCSGPEVCHQVSDKEGNEGILFLYPLKGSEVVEEAPK